jgi:hypothetical protein
MASHSFFTPLFGLGLAACAMFSQTSHASPEPKSGREYYELRTYTLKAEKLPLLDEYLSKALLPALGRLGIGPIGVFSESLEADKLGVTVLTVFHSPDQPLTLAAQLAGDVAYQAAAREYLATLAADPVYERIESSILGAISGMPALIKPDASKSRMLNLRIYESHNERAAAKKLEMFNLGELAIFRRTGLTPVFFGEALAGTRMPNLTYMLVFDDDEARKAAWATFRADPEWVALKAKPEYADKEIVSKVTNRVLTPRPYSGL